MPRGYTSMIVDLVFDKWIIASDAGVAIVVCYFFEDASVFAPVDCSTVYSD